MLDLNEPPYISEIIMPDQTSWTELNFIERESVPIMTPGALTLENLKWIEFVVTDEEAKWIQEINEVVMEFGGVFHSIFLRWAVTINGLHVAEDKYSDPEWKKKGLSFAVQGIRNRKDGSGPELTNVRVWDGNMAAEVHSSSIPMLAAWAFCNMYSCLEEFIFNMFREYLKSNPLEICRGDDFKEIRKLYRERDQSHDKSIAWKTAWDERLESWHRKKLYIGLDKVFKNFISKTGIQIPSFYKGIYNYNDIAKTLGGISLIRNCFIHGVTTVPKELAQFCEEFQSSFFNFTEGEKFSLSLHELATLEHFTDAFTQTLNKSLFELANPDMKDLYKQLKANKQNI
ncbi:hypothetical protein [Oceanospirillum sediminis]|uniref:Uncharacterized protein n=1 Tax=Oceanospirillum sediminis TaxID=2760088 RepID=A0A839IR66_9GAMM|nr:hypothetical protein [Oceanospirillum sediminis]MBB1486706.1 hypothetical protein [Oceanospirillum sediminis]